MRQADLILILPNGMRLNYWECDFPNWDSFVSFWNDLESLAEKMELDIWECILFHQRLA